MSNILKNTEAVPDASALANATEESIAAPAPIVEVRPRVHGKFLFVAEEKLYIRGVTYGTFRSGSDGEEVLDPEVVARDFEMMRANGINAVRTYTVPPRWLLDAA